MKVSVSLTTAQPGVEPRLAARWLVERTAAARDAGLDGLFVGDHHINTSSYLQNVPLMGRLLAEWSDRPFGILALLPLWHPVLLAEQIGTLAALSDGRFILQTGIGYGHSTFKGMGVNERHRPSLFEEALGIVRRLLAGASVSSDGRFRISEAVVAPVPAEPVEVWIGGSAPVAIDRAARLGDGFLAAPGLSRSDAAAQAARDLAACAQHGRAPGSVAIRRDIFVAGTDGEAAEVRAGSANYRGFPAEALVIGTAHEVAETLGAYATLGYTEVTIRHLINDQTAVLGSFERLARVMELIRHA